MKISRNIRKIRRSLITLAIAFPLLYLVFAVASVIQDYRATISDAESDVRNMSVAINEHAIRAIGEADSALRSAIADIERRGLTVPGPDEIEIHKILKEHAQKLPQAVTFSVIDAQGWLRVNGLAFPLQPIDVRDREYFQHQSASSDSDLYISLTAKSRANGKWTFGVSRRINNPDGSLKMLVGGGMALDYFDGFYRSLHIDGDSRVMIVRKDGRVLVESPFTERIADKDIAGTALLAHLAGAPAGNFRVTYSRTSNASDDTDRAKVAGRNCACFFDESMAHQATRRMEIESALRHAIERDELMLHYQPQRSLTSNRIIGVEALLRWSRPGLGLIPPLEFIPLAEESGLIISIGNWVLQSACEQGALWLDDPSMQFRVSVNIAAKQIHHKGFVEQIRSTLAATGLPPAFLELEITESSILENIDETVDKLRQIKALGVTIAIDDFGTGYSSLSYLKQLPIDRLKIDRSFVKDTPGDADDCTIVRTIIALARNLGLSVIAEGVENQEQVDFLSTEGCDEIQGYFLSKPISAEMLYEVYHERMLA